MLRETSNNSGKELRQNELMQQQQQGPPNEQSTTATALTGTTTALTGTATALTGTATALTGTQEPSGPQLFSLTLSYANPQQPCAMFPVTPIVKPSCGEESAFLSETQLTSRKRKKQKKGGGNVLMMIAIIHLMLACGLIDLGFFLNIRFKHYGKVWPESYRKLSISKYVFSRNQIRCIRALYTPVTMSIGLMIFFPKIIYLLSIFFAEVSFWRATVVDGAISLLTSIYACITGVHAYVILDSISRAHLERTDLLCYVIRGPRERAPHALRNRCLLAAYKMFGNHLSLQAAICLLVTAVCAIDIIYFIYYQRRDEMKKETETASKTRSIQKDES